MNAPSLNSRQTKRGFTLVELLVVLAIFAILSAISVSALQGVNSSLNLSTAAKQVVSELTNARQTALTFNETVEVRFYIYPDSSGASTANEMQAMQTFASQDGTTFTQLDKVVYLPANIMINTSTFSYPFGESSGTVNPTYNSTSPGALKLSGPIGPNYTYKTVRFKGNGSIDYIVPSTGAPTTWPPATWYVTLYEKKYATAAAASIKNFVTVNVDSMDGRISTYQP